MPGTWERSTITQLTLVIITFCLHSAQPLLISFDGPQLFSSRRHKQLSPSAPQYGHQLSNLQGWSLANVVVPYIIEVVLHLDQPYFFLCFFFFFFFNLNITEARGKRQIPHDLQDAGILKDACAWQNNFFLLWFPFIFPANASTFAFLCLFPPYHCRPLS